MLLVLDLGISSLVLVISLVLPLIGLFVRHKWRVAAQRREEIRRLLIHASEEAARAELEASVEFSSVAVSNVFHCPVCYCLATTRCSRCKSVRYCSGKCQIIHWRQGHKDECHPASIVYDSEDEKSDSDLRFREENERNTLVETSLLDPEPVTIPIGEAILSNPARSPEDGNGDIADNKDDLIDKEEAVSVAETTGSSFSGFSSSPRNDSGDEISLCESFSSSESERSESLLDAHVSVEPEDTCFSTIDVAPSKLLSPKFVHLVESVDNLANLPKLSVHKPGGDARQNQSQSRSLHSLVTDRHPVSADPSLKSSDFWGTALGSAERVSESCDKSKSGRPGNSSLHYSFGSSRDTSAVKVSEHKSSILKEGTNPALGTGNISDGVNLKERNAKRFVEAEIALPTSSSTDALSSLDTSNLSPVTLPKLKSASSENGCMLAPLKVGEVQPLASKASNTKDCADLMKHSPLGAKSVRVLDHQKQNGTAVHRINSLHGKSGLKASVLKVVDQWTRPKSENEMAGRHGHKGLFPYEVFAKLYTNKIEFQPCGLINVGNSCFANVVFQCLMFTPPLTTYFIQQFHSRACTKKEQCFTCGFEKLVLKAKEGKSPLSPNGLLSQLHNIGIFLGNGKEEDAHEFLRFVVDTMQSVCIKASEYDMPKSSKLEDTTLIGLTFGGYLRSKIKCMKCQVKSELREKMMDLTVEIDGDISTLDDALRRFTRTEILDGENKYRCGSCKSYERAKKKLKITEPPNVLTIALKRFQAGKFGKLNKLIRFPETLDLAPYVSGGSEKSHDYKLYGVIVHLDIMNAAFSGHYVCYIRNQNKWYKADDSTVVTSDVERILTKGAYMLFYARCTPMPPKLAVCTKTEASNKKSRVPVPKAKEKSTISMSRSVSTSSPVLSSNTPGGGRSGNIQSFYSSFQRLQKILEDDSASDSSSLFDSNSDECSCSTDSTSMDDFADFIFGDHQGRAHGQSEAPSPTSSSSSSSPPFTRHSPLSRSSLETYGTSRHQLPLGGER
ncbi:Papain-like cysteine peptidase superfamily [Arabidopsis thaliana x Arabidopsis arenosa]|uniref:ubiquitinyl hydrolase 1 n=1 Tax=Arabidopsis thaliana x Arabidopsis arenosa TaxID=1240361 RepID=A0A8T1Y3I2_9BRAS|nr:Papain-like cysteine peptidase superfamily [Arabidopsis thaliana x Arabidopsis arenosa]